MDEQIILCLLKSLHHFLLVLVHQLEIMFIKLGA